MTNTTDQAIDNALMLVSAFEGFRAGVYRCPAGKWTIGYGSTVLPDGSPVTGNTPPVTEEQAREIARTTLRGLAGEIEKLVTVPLTPKQEGALISLAYNIGTGAFRNSTLLKKLNAGDYEGAAEQFPVWNQCQGKILPGLERRRAAEQKLFEAEVV